MDIPIDVLVAVIAAAPGVVALWSMRNKVAADTGKTQADTDKTHAETESIHAQVADRWAEHVGELQNRVAINEKTIAALNLDVSQVRRENEQYRIELSERDMIIADLKDWATRLIGQLAQHAPDVRPEQFYRKAIGDETTRRLRS